MKPRILTIGSASVINTIRCSAFPRAGQAVTAEKYKLYPGGRGLLAAAAISKLGGDSVICSAVGTDIYGPVMKRFCSSFDVDKRFLFSKPDMRTGCDTVLSSGSDLSVISLAGANAYISRDDIREALTCLPDIVILSCAGLGADTVYAAAEEVRGRRITLVLDTCGITEPFSLERVSSADITMLDADSAQLLTGMYPAGEQSCLRTAGAVEQNISTRYTIIMPGGDRGVFLSDNKFHEMISPFDIDVVDPAAADDVYIGALALDYIRGINRDGRDIDHACTYAALARAWTLATRGSASSMPSESDMREFVKSNGINFEFYD